MTTTERLLRLARPHRARLGAANLCALTATAADLALLALLERFVDRGLAARAPAGLTGLAAAALGAAAVRELAVYLGGRLSLRACVSLVADLRERLFAHLHGLSLDFFQHSPTGDLLSRLFHDVDAAARLATGVLASAVESPLRVLALFGVLWSLDRPLACGAALILVPGVLATRLLGRRLRGRYREAYDVLAGLHDAAEESLSSAETVKILGREDAELAAFAGRSRALVAKETAVYEVEALAGPLGQGLRLVALVGLLAYGGRAVAAGRLSVGALAALLVAAQAFLGALQSLASLYSSAQSGLAAADRVFATLDETPSIPPPARPQPARFRESLAFDRVAFAYPGRAPVLSDVRLVLRLGERVALVGANGSGKTTLLRLALRLYDPTAGVVTLDGADLRALDPKGLRELFAMVPQETVLLDRSLRDNLACGRPDATAEGVESAAERAGVLEFAARLPRGLDTIVGRRGAALSAGERQRVALARALVRDAPILLLDEATSALDAQTASRIEAALAAFARGRTVLAITHRVATLPSFDRILVLEAGRIAEEGTHDGLLARAGSYRRLCAIQGSTASTAEASGRNASS